MIKKLFAAAAFATAFVLSGSLGASAKEASKQPLSPSTLAERVQQYRQVLSVLQNQYVDSLDMETLIKKGLDSMLKSVDPYTEYFSEENLEELTSVSSGNYGGVGSLIALRDSVIIFSDPYYGKPARNAGIRHGDIILEIDDYVLPKKGLNTADISNRLKGNPGSHIRVKVRRPWLPAGSDSVLVFNFDRQKISIDPVPYTTVFDDGIAYIEVSTFNRNTAEDIRKAFADIKAKHGKNLKGVILDLRNNGGGIVEGAVNLLSIFLDRGTMVSETRYRDGSVETYKTRKGPVDTQIPLVVLVNGSTASASEIVSGAIQDLDRGVVMGRRTYGKGLVQTSAPVGFGSVLKYTVGKYYLPSGRLIQARDYRDADGQPTLVPDSLTHEFTTAKGRIVRDGRGISPDVEIQADSTSFLGYQLYTDGWIEDFSNRYRNNHETAPEPGNIVTDEIFEQFKAFVDPDKLKFGRASKSGIEYLREAVKAEGLKNDSITAAINVLEVLVKHDLAQEIDANRKEISELLQTELASRYFSPEEISALTIVDDGDVKEARKLLLDSKLYNSLLQPGVRIDKPKAPGDKAKADAGLDKQKP